MELRGLGLDIPSPSQSVLRRNTSASSSCGVSVGAGAPFILMTSLSMSKDIFSCLIREQPITASYMSMFTTSMYGFADTVWYLRGAITPWLIRARLPLVPSCNPSCLSSFMGSNLATFTRSGETASKVQPESNSVNAFTPFISTYAVRHRRWAFDLSGLAIVFMLDDVKCCIFDSFSAIALNLSEVVHPRRSSWPQTITSSSDSVSESSITSCSGGNSQSESVSDCMCIAPRHSPSESSFLHHSDEVYWNPIGFPSSSWTSVSFLLLGPDGESWF